MEAFFRKHVEKFLMGLAVILVGIMLWCFVWSMIYISQSLDSVFESGSTGVQTVSFNLSGAKSLNLRGFAPH